MRAGAQQAPAVLEGLALLVAGGSLIPKFISNKSEMFRDPNPQYFSKSTAVQMGGVLPYKWEAYCSTNRRMQGFPFFLRSQENGDTNGGRTAVQIGGVLPYLFQVVVFKTLPNKGNSCCFFLDVQGSRAEFVDHYRSSLRSSPQSIVQIAG